MWRAFFFACGVYCCLLGLQCLAIDKAILTTRQPSTPRFLGMQMTGVVPGSNKELTPPDWAPWSLMSLGAVTLLYSFTIPNRGK